MVVLDRFFSFGGQKKRSLVALDRWSSYTVTFAWELALADFGRLIEVDCIPFSSSFGNNVC